MYIFVAATNMQVRLSWEIEKECRGYSFFHPSYYDGKGECWAHIEISTGAHPHHGILIFV